MNTTKKSYIAPAIETEQLDAVDVIRTSDETEEYHTENRGPWDPQF